MAINLSGYKKVAEDKNSVLMKHDKGHEMKIVLHALPKIEQEKIKRIKLADGGNVPAPVPAQPVQTPVQMAQDSMRKAFNYKDGGKVKYYNSDGAVTNDDSSDDSTDTPPAKSPVTVNVNAAPSNSPPTVPVTTSPTTAMANAVPQEGVQVPPTPANTNLLNNDNTLNAPAAVNLQQKAAREQQAVDSEKGAQQAKMEKAYQDQRAQEAQIDQNNYNDVKQHTDDFKTYIANNPIDPTHYQQNMGTGQKVATAFGLLMGGLKQGHSGGNNPAMDFLNSQIDRDIQGQKDRMGQQKTVLGAYQSLYGDANVANNLAKISVNDIYASKGKQIADNIATPQAKAVADAFAAQKGIENEQLLVDTAGRLGQLGKGGGGQAQPQPLQGQPIGIQNTSAPGKPGSPTAPPPLLKPDSYADSPILAPGAEAQLDRLRYTPKAKDDIANIQGKYEQAKQADMVLDQLHDVHQQMAQDANTGGSAGYLRRHDPSAAIPFVGHALSSMFIQPSTDTQNNREYDANKTRITSDIANALKGTNVSGEEIQNIVDANSPEHGDTPKMVAQKERNIRVFVKNAVNQGVSSDWHLTNSYKSSK